MGVLVTQGRREDLLHLLDFIEAQESGLRTEPSGVDLECVLPFRDDPAMPREAFVLAAHERPAS
jgi:hypothetical protein